MKHLYVHIPFCHRICPYCSFHKHTPGGTDMAAFVDALLKESEKQALKPQTIFFGGGTPTMLSLTITERSGRPRRHASNKTKTATAAPWSAAVETPAATRSKARVAAEGCTGSVGSAVSTCQAWQGSDWPALRTGS